MLFDRTRNPPDAEARRRLQEQARIAFAATDEETILVTQLRCSEPGCPPLETVIAHLAGDGSRRQLKIHKPMAEVTPDDLRAALAISPGTSIDGSGKLPGKESTQ